MRTCVIAAALALACTVAHGQRADCPRGDAPLPHKPPGEPPSFVPSFSPPARFGDPVMVPPPAAEFIDGEEGHVAEPLWVARTASREPPPSARLASRARIESTPLADWRFAGFGRDPSPNRLLRAYEGEGMTVIVEVFDQDAEGVTIAGSAPANVHLDSQPAIRTAIRSPSGCVNAHLSWTSDGVTRSLSAAGPLGLEAQRRLLVEIGRGMVRDAQNARP